MRGGSIACAGPRTILTTSASIISAASPSSGRFRERTHRDSWALGRRSEGRFIREAARALGGLPFFAEDLGYITPDVHALRERLKIPGMAVLQFGFGDVGAHVHLPHTFTTEKVVYTGTHDNDTLLGWWKSGATEYERQQVEQYLGPL
jgi:4-alpha-glucanotransferase